MFGVDEVRVSTSLLSINPAFFQNATIRGLSFRSRGSWRREKTMPKRQYGAQKLILKGSYLSELQYSFRDKKKALLVGVFSNNRLILNFMDKLTDSFN